MSESKFDRPALAALVAILLCSRLAVALTAPPQYVLTDIGTLYNTDADARAINNQGVIVGVCYNPGRGSRAFRTGPTLPINPATDNLGAVNNLESVAFGVNGLGQSAGWVRTNDFTSTGTYQGARYPATGANVAASSLIGSFGGLQTVGWDINDSGQVVGNSRYANQTTNRAFRTGPNQSINSATDDLGTLGGASATAFGINNGGQVTGQAALAGSGGSHAFRTKPNQAINPLTDDLGTLGASTYSEGADINSAGWVVGTSATASGDTRAFLVPPNRAIDPLTDNLGALAGFDDSHATALNNSQVVVGYNFKFSGQTYRPFVFDGTAMYDLNALVAPASLSGWVLHVANDINDRGQIVGNGLFNGQNRAFLLTPVPEPAAIMLAFVAITGASCVPLRRRWPAQIGHQRS